MNRLHLCIKLGTMLSGLLLLCTLMQYCLSYSRRQYLIVEHKRKVSMSITGTPQDYLNYMRLWIFHNISSQVSLISDVILGDMRTVAFYLSAEADPMPEPPFGNIQHHKPSTIKWSMPAFANSISYPPIESSITFMLQYIAMRHDGFSLLLNNDLIEYNASGDWVPQEDGFYIIPGGLVVHKNASVDSVSVDGIVLRLQTPEGEQFHKILCNQRLEVKY